eukprot:scaffold15356_cov204-Skeletonema_dohrnii-CCMP3373.AAC.1
MEKERRDSMNTIGEPGDISQLRPSKGKTECKSSTGGSGVGGTYRIGKGDTTSLSKGRGTTGDDRKRKRLLAKPKMNFIQA